jgi:arabinofuranosyltransferase
VNGVVWQRCVWPGLAGAGVVALGAAAWPYTVDDAYVVARYAGHLCEGTGYVMNPGGPVTDGVTGPLWLLPMTMGVAGAKVTGLACAAVAAVMAVIAVQRMFGPWAAAAAALFAVSSSSLSLWGVAGLEAGAAALAVTALGLTGAGALTLGWPVVGLGLAAVPWLRPEVVPLAWVAVLALAWRDRRAGGRAAVVGLVGLLSVALFRLVLFGSPLPMSAAAKPPELAQGLAYVGRALVAVVGPGALLLMAAVARRRERTVLVCTALVGVHLASTAVAGGDWMPGYRLLTPIVPLVAAIVGVGVARFDHRPLLAAGAVVLACAAPLLDAWVQVPEARWAGRQRQEVGRPLGQWLGRRFEHVALVDAGYLPWVGGFRVLDLAGITEPRVAHAPGGHLDKRFDPGILADAPPDAIVLHSAAPPVVGAAGHLEGLAGFPVERRVASLPWVRAHYRAIRVVRYAPRYHYVILARTERPSRLAQGPPDESAPD